MNWIKNEITVFHTLFLTPINIFRKIGLITILKKRITVYKTKTLAKNFPLRMPSWFINFWPRNSKNLGLLQSKDVEITYF